MAITLLNPFTFGLMIVIAVGTVAYQVYSQRNTFELPNNHYVNNKPSSIIIIPRDTSTVADDDEKKKKEDMDKCSICHEVPLKRDQKALPCNHIFHSDCIKQWFKVKTSCPVCRKVFKIMV
ncbi:unnamed protein product [Phaedon cochleariae]|uniref:RING-type domain-containing protein n=1 Tax=Phaedon cochleariae TaxID=80249 RepID=A0A9P0GL11_PHACE|nr:unnamed protein product [Phaedon cochleariae]